MLKVDEYNTLEMKLKKETSIAAYFEKSGRKGIEECSRVKKLLTVVCVAAGIESMSLSSSSTSYTPSATKKEFCGKVKNFCMPKFY